MYASTLTRSSSGKELLLPLGKLFHALQSFFLGHSGAPWALNFNFFDYLQLLHETSANILLYLIIRCNPTVTPRVSRVTIGSAREGHAITQLTLPTIYVWSEEG